MSTKMFPLRRATDCLLRDIQYIERVVDTVHTEIADSTTATTILALLFDTAPPSFRIKQEMVLVTCLWRILMTAHSPKNDKILDDCGVQSALNDNSVVPAVFSVLRFDDSEPSQVLLRPFEVPENWSVQIARCYVLWHAAEPEREYELVIDTDSNIWCAMVQWTQTQFKEWMSKDHMGWANWV